MFSQVTDEPVFQLWCCIWAVYVHLCIQVSSYVYEDFSINCCWSPTNSCVQSGSQLMIWTCLLMNRDTTFEPPGLSLCKRWYSGTAGGHELVTSLNCLPCVLLPCRLRFKDDWLRLDTNQFCSWLHAQSKTWAADAKNINMCSASDLAG